MKKKNVSSFANLYIRNKDKSVQKAFWGGIKPKTIGFVFGLAKSGKTIFCENLALIIASGETTFLNKPVDLPNKKVLFISMEEDVDTRMRVRGNKQFESFSSAEKKLIEQNLYYSDKGFPRSIENIQNWNQLESLIKELSPKVVFLDSTNRLDIDIYKRDQVNKMMRIIRGFAQKYRCAIILIHHTVKSQRNKAMSLEHLSGDSALTRDADFFIGVNHFTNGIRYINFLENRYYPPPEKCINVEIQDNLLLEFKGEVHETELLKLLDGRIKKSNMESIFDYIKENVKLNKEFKTKVVLSKFVNNDDSMSKKTLYNQLDNLEKEGVIKKLKQGVYKRLR